MIQRDGTNSACRLLGRPRAGRAAAWCNAKIICAVHDEAVRPLTPVGAPAPESPSAPVPESISPPMSPPIAAVMAGAGIASRRSTWPRVAAACVSAAWSSTAGRRFTGSPEAIRSGVEGESGRREARPATRARRPPGCRPPAARRRRRPGRRSAPSLPGARTRGRSPRRWRRRPGIGPPRGRRLAHDGLAVAARCGAARHPADPPLRTSERPEFPRGRPPGSRAAALRIGYDGACIAGPAPGRDGSGPAPARPHPDRTRCRSARQRAAARARPMEPRAPPGARGARQRRAMACGSTAGSPSRGSVVCQGAPVRALA